MNKKAKTKQQLLLEIEELRTRVDVAQQRLQEANEGMRTEMAERKRVEEDFMRARKQAESIVETIREPLLVLTADLIVISANQSFYRTFKVTPEETEGRFIYNVGNHQWDIPALRKLLEEIVPQNSQFTDFEVDHEFPGIGPKKILLNARRIYQQGKGTERILLAIEDITERTRAKKVLEVSETRYRRLFETAQDGILILDADTGNISDVNPFLIQMLGYTHEEFLGRKLWEIGAFRDVEASKAAFSELQTRGYVRYEDLPLQTKDGRFIAVEFVSNVYLVDHQKVIQCNIRDITERKEAENQIRRLNEELTRKNFHLESANRELEAYNSTVSHDLKNPLVVMGNVTGRLIKKYGEELDAKGKEYLEILQSTCNRMTELVDDLLELSQASKTEMKDERVDLSSLAKALLAEYLQKDPSRSVEYSVAEECVCRGDRRLLRVVLDNLLGNAWKFTRDCECARIEFGYFEEDGRTIYFVRDNGCGFDTAHAETLFLPFQRFHREEDYPGTGIGLASVSRIINRHGGRIWAKSFPGQGAIFYFAF